MIVTVVYRLPRNSTIASAACDGRWLASYTVLAALRRFAQAPPPLAAVARSLASSAGADGPGVNLGAAASGHSRN